MKIALKKGFTLIELLVVIAIIGILTAVVLANLTSAKAKSRDAKRISDLAQLQLALTLVFDKCNEYPASIAIDDTICTVNETAYKLSSFITKIPTDPSSGSEYAYFRSNDKFDYRIQAGLETGGTTGVTSNVGSSACGSNYCVSPR